MAEKILEVNPGDAYASETIPVSSTAIGFTDGLIEQAGMVASKAFFIVEDDDIRITEDGTVPVAGGPGQPIVATDGITIEGALNIKNFLAIRETTDASIFVTYFR